MRSSRLALSLLVLGVTGPAVAQTSHEPPAGATMRWSEAGRQRQGTLVDRPDATGPYRIALRGTQDTLLVPRTARELAWKARGSRKLLGAAIGLGAGTLLGYVVGTEASADCSGWCFEEVTKMMTASLGGLVGGVTGAIVAPGSRWVDVAGGRQIAMLLGPGRVGFRIIP